MRALLAARAPTPSCIRHRHCSGSRSKCTCFSSSAAKWNDSSAGALSSALYAAAALAPVAFSHPLGTSAADRTGRFVAFHFGIFIAFATIYPNVELLLRIRRNGSRLIFAAIYVLQLLAYHAWAELAVLWISIAAGFLFIRLRGVGPELVWWDNLKTRLQSEAEVPRRARNRAPAAWSSRDDIYESIDPILDKISKSGIGSLTAGERRALDRARDRLLERIGVTDLQRRSVRSSDQIALFEMKRRGCAAAR